LAIFVLTPKEPTYEGKTLKQWLLYYSREAGGSMFSNREEQEAAKKAIRAMGTNCLPFVIKWMSKDYPEFLASFHRKDSGRAGKVLEILGKEARPTAIAMFTLRLSYRKGKLARILCLCIRFIGCREKIRLMGRRHQSNCSSRPKPSGNCASINPNTFSENHWRLQTWIFLLSQTNEPAKTDTMPFKVQ
jgi:hypothetical protein